MNMKLLIVDDDLPFRERLTRSMEKKGFEVISSPGFKDSIAKVNDNNFDYAVVDMRLEDGSGLELVKELNKLRDMVRKVFLKETGTILPTPNGGNLPPFTALDLSSENLSAKSSNS